MSAFNYLNPHNSHFTHLAVKKLENLGVTPAGAMQATSGQCITNPSDRELIAYMLVETINSPGNTAQSMRIGKRP